MSGIRVGEASNPGPPRHAKHKDDRRRDSLSLFFANVRGIVGEKSLGKWEFFRQRAQDLHADVIALSETHQDDRRAERFSKASAKAGFPGYVCSPGTGNSMGTMLAGPKGFALDPFSWPIEYKGRVCSAVLRCGRADLLLISVYFPVGGGEAKRQRQDLAEIIAGRVSSASLPTIVMGDFNAQPHDPELAALESVCEYAHEHTKYEYLSTASSCLDFALVRHVAVTEVSLDARMSDHSGILLRIDFSGSCQFTTIKSYPDLRVSQEEWHLLWSNVWSRTRDTWERALHNGDTEELWRIWSTALEEAGGVAPHLAHRFRGTELHTMDLVFKGPNASRMNHRERRLHRVWRQITELVKQWERGNVDANLLNKATRAFRNLCREGFIEEDATEPVDMQQALDVAIRAEAKETALDRFTIWKEGARKAGLKPLFDFIGGKTRCGQVAVTTPDGLTADPAAVLAHAQAQWNRKNHSALDDDLRQAYLRRVRPHVVPHVPPHDVDRPFSVKELRRALKDTSGSAPGPSQWSADQLLKAPAEALEMLVTLLNTIKDTGVWPAALRMQEVTMIPKRAGASDMRPIGVTAVVTRILEKMLLSRYKPWVAQIQKTDATEILLSVEAHITHATSTGQQCIFRQSDLSNCFTRLDVDIAKQLAQWFGMLPKHAELYFELNRRRPAVIKAGSAVSQWQVPDRGMPQGDPVSPLAAALYAAAHEAVIRNDFPAASFYTFVDDRTICTTQEQHMTGVVNLLRELDHLSGQAEDATKEEMAIVNAVPESRDLFPHARDEYIDLLGIRFDLNGKAAPSTAPRARARFKELGLRVERLGKITRNLQLGSSQLCKVMIATMGLFRWDAAWISCNYSEVKSLATKIEVTLQARKRYAAWRHRGASWVLQPKGWHVEPIALITFAAICAGRRLQFSSWRTVIEHAWSQPSGFRKSLVDHMRDAYERVGWEATDSPWTVQTPQGSFDLNMISRAVFGHLLRQGWRHYMMKCHNSCRHVCIDVDSIDVVPLRKFVDATVPSSRALAWRCAVAAEPNHERMAHIDPVTFPSQACPHCGAQRATTFHLMYECDSSAALRAELDLQPDALGGDLAGSQRAAWLQNGWAQWVPPPAAGDWTWHRITQWIEEVRALLVAHPPKLFNGEFLIATDGSAQSPADPETRVAACAAVWRTSSGLISWSQPLGNIENTVNAAELVIVVVVAKAAEAASMASSLRILTDHERVPAAFKSSKSSCDKVSLWNALKEVHRDAGFRLSWVPAHGKHAHVHVPTEWRELNMEADRHASLAARGAVHLLIPWIGEVKRKRQRAADILRLKLEVFRPTHLQLLAGAGVRS